MVRSGDGCDVGESGAFEDHAGSETAGDEVGKVDGCVDADGCEGGCSC